MAETIIAERPTVLKKHPLQSDELPATEVKPVPKGRKYPVIEFERLDDDHVRVVLAHSAGEWFIYDGDRHNSHWDCSWERDRGETDEALDPYPILDKTTPDRVTPDSDFATRFTPNFTYGEWCKYEERRRASTQAQCDAMLFGSQFLERVRSRFGNNVVRIHSGLRPEPVNSSVGGASRSEHLGLPYWHRGKEKATFGVDFSLAGVDLREVERWVDVQWPYSLGYGARADRGFIHIGIREGEKHRRWPY
ncbi:MAG: D-Ala-D-Ala carboxypeptidase family metallohydrolase [Cyanobacteria bacterium J06638_20]